MPRIRYVGPAPQYLGTRAQGTFSQGEAREVSEDVHAYLLANLHEWFEDASDGSPPAPATSPAPADAPPAKNRAARPRQK